MEGRKVRQKTPGRDKHASASKEHRSSHLINETYHPGLIDTRMNDFGLNLPRGQHNQVAIQKITESPQTSIHSRQYDHPWHSRTNAVDLRVCEMGSQNGKILDEGYAKHRFLSDLVERLRNFNNNKADRHWPGNSPSGPNSFSYTHSSSMQAPCVPAPPFNLPVDSSVCFGTDQIDVLLFLAASNLTGTDMVAACKRALQFSDLNNVLGNYLVAIKYNLTDTMCRMIQVIRKNFVAISQTKEFLSLPLEYVLIFLEDSNLNVENELDVYAAALTWIDYNKQQRIPVAGRILKSIRYAHIHPDDIATYVEPNLNLFTGQDGAEALVSLYKNHVYAGLPGYRKLPPKRRMPGMFDRTVIVSDQPCVTQDSRVFVPGSQHPGRPPNQQEPYRPQLDIEQLQAQPHKKVTFTDNKTATSTGATPATNTPTVSPGPAYGTTAQTTSAPIAPTMPPGPAHGTTAQTTSAPIAPTMPPGPANGTSAHITSALNAPKVPPGHANGTPAQTTLEPNAPTLPPGRANGTPAHTMLAPNAPTVPPGRANGTPSQSTPAPNAPTVPPGRANGTTARTSLAPNAPTMPPGPRNGTSAQITPAPNAPTVPPGHANGATAQTNSAPNAPTMPPGPANGTTGHTMLAPNAPTVPPGPANGTTGHTMLAPNAPTMPPGPANGTTGHTMSAPNDPTVPPDPTNGAQAQKPDLMNRNASKRGTPYPQWPYWKETTYRSPHTFGRYQDYSESNRATSSRARAPPIITHWDGSRRDVFRAVQCVARDRMEDRAERTRVEAWTEKNRVWMRLDEGSPRRRSEPPRNTCMNSGSRGMSSSFNRNLASSRQSHDCDTKRDGKVFKVSGAIPRGPIILVSN